MMDFLEKNINNLQDRFKKLTDDKKKQIVLICTAGFTVILIFSVLVSVSRSVKNTKEEERLREPDRINYIIAIPPEEIFLPEEPDFIPGVLLERERRTNWTEQDAAEYWQDPLKYGEEQWREKIEKTIIEEILERVP
jgi:hypothetical protein